MDKERVAAGLAIAAAVAAGLFVGVRGTDRIVSVVATLPDGGSYDAGPHRPGKVAHQYGVVDEQGRAHNCGTIRDLARWRLAKPPYSDQARACRRAWAPDNRCAKCDETFDTPAHLCRFGRRAGTQERCDPDAEQCQPYPCGVVLGQSADEIASEPPVLTGSFDVDAGGA